MATTDLIRTYAEINSALSHIALLTEPYVDDEEVSDVKRQYDDFRKQHNVEL